MVLIQRRFLTHVFSREDKCHLWLFDTGFLVYPSCESILQNCPAGEAQLVRACQCGSSPPGHWEHCAVGTDLLECSPGSLVKVKCVSSCTEMEDEGRHSAVINKCIQACLGLPNQLVPFPEQKKN